MRIVRVTKKGREGLGLIQADDAIAVRWGDEGFGAAEFLKALGAGPSGLAAFAGELKKGTPLRLDEVSLSTPVPLTGKILCLGANFGEHATEANFAHSKHAPVFMRIRDS